MLTSAFSPFLWPPHQHAVCLLRSTASHSGLSTSPPQDGCPLSPALARATPSSRRMTRKVDVLSAWPFLCCPQKTRLFCSVNASDIHKGLRSHCSQPVPASVLWPLAALQPPATSPLSPRGCCAWTSWEGCAGRPSCGTCSAGLLREVVPLSQGHTLSSPV